MSSLGDVTLPATRRSRKSTSGSPTRKGAQRENATIDVGSAMGAGRKKSRSKSIGPGGLDVLKTGTGNRRVSLAVPSRPPPRSILKPTMPLLQEIPPHKSKAGAKPEKLPSPPTDADVEGSGTKIALRTEEEQQAAAREREERERAEMEKEINDRREARRKSLANRRVSFAAEATLHTFHEVEFMQDSTTSTDSTRRASSAAGKSPAPQAQHPSSDPSEPPSTPPEHVEDAAELPTNQRNLHQRKLRRSSGLSDPDYSNPDDDTMNTTIYSSDSEHADGIAEIQAEDMTSNIDSDEEDGTMMTVEAEEMTSVSVVSGNFDTSAESTGDLDDNLRLAARHATTQGVDEEEEEEVIAGFAGWGKKPTSQQTAARRDEENLAQQRAPNQARPQPDEDDGMEMDMTTAVGGILHHSVSPERDQDEDMSMDMDMSMDVTRALGGIIAQPAPQTRRKSIKLNADRPGNDESELGEATMDLTMAVGRIQPGRNSGGSQADTEINEDMSMEFTTAMGGVLSKALPPAAHNAPRPTTHQASDDTEDDDTPMEMTTAIGQILATEEDDEEDVDEEGHTMNMEMTVAMGSILKTASPAEIRPAAKKVMEKEADQPDPSITTPVEIQSPLPKTGSVSRHDAGTPEVAAFHGSSLRRSPARESPKRSLTIKKTPNKDLSAGLLKGATETPPSMLGSRSSSPKRQASPTARSTPRSPLKSKTPGNSIFQRDPATGTTTPKVVLTPQKRPLSGLGADRAGLGSPRVTEILSRRESLGDASSPFIPSQGTTPRRTVAFADPRVMEEEIEKERRGDEDRENGRKIMEREADDTTQTLKEMIESLTPKKNPLRGRKSLHVGSAAGVLGKRPAELDDDEEDEDQDGVKRLKGYHGSPVKNVRLKSPPSKAETTTGRKTRSSHNNTDQNHTDNITPSTRQSPTRATTPKEQGRFRNVGNDEPTSTVNFDGAAPVSEVDVQEDQEDRIHLQDFLNLTSIRFMELTTTKRRHTVAPHAPKDIAQIDSKEEMSLEQCIVAGACTVPLLELYQHSCRELRKYISEGRGIVRKIETETFEENPPLFREYMSATPDFKILMDNQFKNVKTHARLQSKAMWYEWRMKLQDGLKEGLLKTLDGLENDDQVLKKQQDLLSTALPPLVKYLENLEQLHDDLQAVARELADCDPEDLQNVRAQLVAADDAIEEKAKKIAELRRQLQESEIGIEALTKRKQECLDGIKEAEKVREECRGWSSTEISTSKAKVEQIEKEHGWAITGCQGTVMSMTYKREIELVFDAAAFGPGQTPQEHPSSTIDLWYIAANRQRDPQPLTPERDFFLRCIRDHLRGRILPQAHQFPVSRMLRVVSATWDHAKAVAGHVRLLNVTFPTTVTRTSDNSIAVKCIILLVPLKTKVSLEFDLRHVGDSDGEIVVSFKPRARVVYGEQFNPEKIAEYVSLRLGDRVRSGKDAEEPWSDVVVDLRQKLLKGKK